MTQIVRLSSSDGRFGVSVSADDVELIASVLLLLEMPRQAEVHHLSVVSDAREESRALVALAS